MVTFGTAVNCTDGRVQEAVARWVRDTYRVDHVDMITEPGVDKVLAVGSIQSLAIRDKVAFSVSAHHSNVVVLAGHYDCAGNPVPKDRHVEDLKKAVQRMGWWNFPVTLAALWVNERWEVAVLAQ